MGDAAAIVDSGLLINSRPGSNYQSFESLVLNISYPILKSIQPVQFVIPNLHQMCVHTDTAALHMYIEYTVQAKTKKHIM